MSLADDGPSTSIQPPLSRRQIQLLAELAEIKRIHAAVSARLTSFRSPCLVVTSAAKGEGKSSIAALVATAAASYHRKRVLLADLNWHEPTMHRCFEGGSRLAFSAGKPLIDYAQPTALERLDLLCAPDLSTDASGPGSLEAALALIENARSRYELTILDTSALYPTNRFMLDPVVLSAAADGAVLVVLAAVTPRQRVKRALISLESAGSNVVGTIINQWRNPVQVD